MSYRVRSGTNLNESNPTGVLVFCPFDGNTLHCDGSVTVEKSGWKPPGRAFMDVVRNEFLEPLASACPVVLVIGLVLLWVGSRLKWEARGGPKPQGLILGEVLLLILAILIIGLLLFGAA